MAIFEGIQRAQVANIVRAQVTDTILDIEEAVISSAIGALRQGELTPERAYGAIGEISGLRKLVERLDSEIEKGQRVEEQLELRYGNDIETEHPDDYAY